MANLISSLVKYIRDRWPLNEQRVLEEWRLLDLSSRLSDAVEQDEFDDQAIDDTPEYFERRSIQPIREVGLGLETQTRVLVRNSNVLEPPKQVGLLDNTLLCLPAAAVAQLGLVPNIEDKAQPKRLWFGRVWQLSALTRRRYKLVKGESSYVVPAGMEERLISMRRDPAKIRRIILVQARWRANLERSRSSLLFLDRLQDCCRGLIIFMHGSGGMTHNNLRYARMLAGMNYLVIAPDHMAHGRFRSRDLSKLHTLKSDTDYWANNLVYTSDAKGGTEGDYTYCTQVDAVLDDPDKYRKLYEEVFKTRTNELHWVLRHLPHFAKRMGVFLMGTSEGAMTVARFDDQQYGRLISGRIISAFSVEYCYFTASPEAALLGGSLKVPTLNIIGTHDEYFGFNRSIAQCIAKNQITGYGDPNFTGNAFNTFHKQGVTCGLVCVLQHARHDATITHDNFLRDLLLAFLQRPHLCKHLDELWAHDVYLSSMCTVAQKTEQIIQMNVSKMPFPQRLPNSAVSALRASGRHTWDRRHDTWSQVHEKLQEIEASDLLKAQQTAEIVMAQSASNMLRVVQEGKWWAEKRAARQILSAMDNPTQIVSKL